jgi:hypothetical protein
MIALDQDVTASVNIHVVPVVGVRLSARYSNSLCAVVDIVCYRRAVTGLKDCGCAASVVEVEKINLRQHDRVNVAAAISASVEVSAKAHESWNASRRGHLPEATQAPSPPGNQDQSCVKLSLVAKR